MSGGPIRCVAPYISFALISRTRSTGQDHDYQQDHDPRDRPDKEEGGKDCQDGDDRSQDDRDADQVGVAAHGDIKADRRRPRIAGSG